MQFNVTEKYHCRLCASKKMDNQRLNLNCRTLTFAGVDNWPFLGLQLENKKSPYLKEGIDVSIIHALADFFNFK